MKVLSTLVATTVLGCAPAHAEYFGEAVTFEKRAPIDLVEKKSVSVNVNFQKRFHSIQRVCFELFFEHDLLDPGETILVGPLDRFSYGWSNVFDQSVSYRTICLSAKQRGVALFLDGEQSFDIRMEKGSAEIREMNVWVEARSVWPTHSKTMI